jgi:hypothetical protein
MDCRTVGFCFFGENGRSTAFSSFGGPRLSAFACKKDACEVINSASQARLSRQAKITSVAAGDHEWMA